MKKIVDIGDKQVVFENCAITPLLYKREFGTDYYGDLFKMNDAFDGETIKSFEGIDFNVFSQMAYACAKTADEKIGTFEDWLRANPDFNLFTHGMEIMSLLTDSIDTKKK